MGGITVDDFTSSVAYREIYRLACKEGRQLSRHEGRQVEVASLNPLDVLADAWLDFHGLGDLNVWLGCYNG
jgi:hypothetical protein